MKIDLLDPAMVRKIAGLAVDHGTTPQRLAVALLAKALEEAPEPQARVAVRATTGKATATQRHAQEVLSVLLDRPAGLTYRDAVETFGWSKPTAIEVFRYLRAEGLVEETYLATGGAPALVFKLSQKGT